MGRDRPQDTGGGKKREKERQQGEAAGRGSRERQQGEGRRRMQLQIRQRLHVLQQRCRGERVKDQILCQAYTDGKASLQPGTYLFSRKQSEEAGAERAWRDGGESIDDRKIERRAGGVHISFCRKENAYANSNSIDNESCRLVQTSAGQNLLFAAEQVGDIVKVTEEFCFTGTCKRCEMVVSGGTIKEIGCETYNGSSDQTHSVYGGNTEAHQSQLIRSCLCAVPENDDLHVELLPMVEDNDGWCAWLSVQAEGAFDDKAPQEEDGEASEHSFFV